MCEVPSVYREETPKARKEHHCCECRGVISIGEAYHRHSGIWDGEPGEYKVCGDCEALRQEMNKGVHYPDDMVPFEGVCEHAMESRDQKLISKFLDILRKRGVEVPAWMLAKENAAH